ncbi:MAG: glycosyltransferase, partial [Halothiobacillaceae bacterium]
LMGTGPEVLNIYKTYFPDPPGGLQEAIRQTALATTEAGVCNRLFTLSPRPKPARIDFPEMAVHRCRAWAAPASCDLGGTGALRTFRQLARQADLLHYYFPWPFADLLDLAAPRGTPAIMTYVSDVVRQKWLGRAYQPLMWRTLRRMRIIVANSPAYRETSPVLSHPVLRDRVRVIPLGIDETRYDSRPDPEIFARVGVSPGEPFLLFLGVLRYYKGLPFLLRAARGLDVPVVVAGSGPEQARLAAQVRDEGIANVRFAGQVSHAEKVALLSACVGLVLPSHLRSEAYGMVLVEASMFGKPMVSCAIGTGTSFVNQHERTGLVVPPESPPALQEALRCLLDDPGQAEAWGRAARARYEECFSGAALGKAYAELYREVAG